MAFVGGQEWWNTVAAPHSLSIVVTHDSGNSCANGPTISVDNPAPAAGSMINVTVACGPGNQKDFVQLAIDYNRQAFGPYFYLNGATSGTFSFTIPQVAQDRPAYYVAGFYANDTFQQLTVAPLVVPPTISPPPPTQTLPPALAADPFVPAHTYTVCASGCDYTNLGDATNAAALVDYVLIKVSSGEYPFPQNWLSSNYPPHLWIRGVGPRMPHFWGRIDSSGTILGTHQATCPSKATFTMDNLELGPWTYWLVSSSDCITFTMRNSYIHNSPQGMITGNSQHLTLNIYNSVFARHGSGNGPAHDIYVGEGDHTNVVTVKNSVFEQPLVGYAFKERAQTLNANCSMFIVNQDRVYLGSETIDFSEGGQATLTNILSAVGGANVPWSANNTWDSMRYGYEAGTPPNLTFANNTPLITGSVFLDDDPTTDHDMFTMGLPVTPTPPVTWSGNRFVWLSAQAAKMGPVWYSNTRYGHPGDIVLDSSNKTFLSRAAAALPEVGTYPKGWRNFLPMMPAACTDPIGNVKIPAN